MLAEIFMVRLEATARLADQTPPPRNSRFMPFVKGNESTFKNHTARPAHRPAEAAKEQP